MEARLALAVGFIPLKEEVAGLGPVRPTRSVFAGSWAVIDQRLEWAGQFTADEHRTRSGGWVSTADLRGAVMPAGMRAAWVKRNVEEVGDLPFFLPELYWRETTAGSA